MSFCDHDLRRLKEQWAGSENAPENYWAEGLALLARLEKAEAILNNLCKYHPEFKNIKSFKAWRKEAGK